MRMRRAAAVTKRLIDLDDELLARAQRALSTTGVSDTVRAALQQAASAAARMRLVAVADRLEPLISGGLVATCATLDAEALYSVRSPAEYEQVRADRREAYEYLPTDDGHWQRAFDAQRA